MRCLLLIYVLSAVVAQAQNCTGTARSFDVHCMCETDPNGQVCALVKKGFYDGKMKMATLPPASPGWLSITQDKTAAAAAAPKPLPVRPRQARVVPLPSKDFLRVLQPNAFLAAGFDFEKMFRVPEVMEALLGSGEGSGDTNKLLAALQEADHMWISIAPPNDVVLLMTGRFEKGAGAGLFYSQRITPVFLGDAHAMTIGPEPSIQSALARMARPPVNDGWATRRAREMSKDHESWIVTELPKSADRANSEAPLQHVRRFTLGFRLTEDASLDGEAVADSAASAQEIAAWIDRIKTLVREKTGSAVLDPLKVSLDGPALRFEAKDSGFLTGNAGKDGDEFRFWSRAVSDRDGWIPGNSHPDRCRRQDRGGRNRHEARRCSASAGYASQGFLHPGIGHAARDLVLSSPLRQAVQGTIRRRSGYAASLLKRARDRNRRK